ncbi:MAG: DNA-directed RNA polymerase subunit K [Thermoproteota archaeon]|nr:DNA-directed RNA polymerase subunit K [Thermoproteota archaeon]
MVLKRSSTEKLSKKSSPTSEKSPKKQPKLAKKTKKNLKGKARQVEKNKTPQDETIPPSQSKRPIDEVVVYPEIEFKVRELVVDDNQVMIGPPRLTRFERARITGARSLQLSLGAPSLISWTDEIRDTITLATAELDARVLPISIRRVLPNGLYQDIPIDWMK